jgi:acetyltransferase
MTSGAQRQIRHDLQPLMSPQSIAVVGASQRDTRANRVIRTLKAIGYEGDIFPINPRYSEVLGLPCYPDLETTPKPADCAVVAIQAVRVPEVVDSAAAAGIRAAVILASGFGEAGEDGRRLQAQLEEAARLKGLLICGPNCFGILDVQRHAASFIGALPRELVAGDVALVSQSGGLTNVVVPPLMDVRGVGFSYVVSCGNQAGVTIEEYINYLVDDECTHVIAAFVEGFRRPDLLLETAERAASAGKAIVMLKVGRSEIGRRSALAHTGSLVGAASVTEAAFAKAGIVHVRTLPEFIETIAMLSVPRVRQLAGQQARAAVLTGTGGMTGYIGDAAEDLGVEIPPLAVPTRERLSAALPKFAAASNPLDGTGAMFEDPNLLPSLLSPLAEDPSVDVVAVNVDFNRPGSGPDAPRTLFVPAIVEAAPQLEKPVVVFTTRSGALLDADIAALLRSAGVPLLDGAEQTLAAIRNLARYATSITRESGSRASVSTAREHGSIHALIEGRAGVLDADTAFRLFADAGIPTALFEVATTEDQAVDAALRMGPPVALKIEAAAIQHKSDVGGVELGLASEAAVREGYRRIHTRMSQLLGPTTPGAVLVQQMAAPGIEMLLGVKRDPHFGPVVACGFGGIFVELLDDVAIGLPPLTHGEAEGMVRGLRGWPLLDGARGRARADVSALCDAIVALSALTIALGDRVEAIDANPLIVHEAGRGIVAVDALVQIA